MRIFGREETNLVRITQLPTTIMRSLIMLAIIVSHQFSGSAYNLRQTSNSDGLSNSAILSLCRDDDGYLWIGTCDGVNIADGTSINPFSSIYPGQSLSGNVIEKIFNSGGGRTWVLSNHALDLVDSKTWKVKSFPQFHGQELMCSDPEGTLYILAEDSRLHCYNPNTDSDFVNLPRLNHVFTDVICMTIRSNSLWVVTREGIFLYSLNALLKKTKDATRPNKIIAGTDAVFAKVQNDKLFIITPDGYICEVMADGNVKKITNIAAELAKRGQVSGLVNDHQGNFFISFSTDGAIWVGINSKGEFQAVDLGLPVGVFCLEQSSDQDVVWIGSDCQGVYTYWDDMYSVRSYDFNAFNKKISHPVRAIHIDKQKNMWLGTKGDGLLKISGINEFYPRHDLGDGYLFTSANSALQHNSVFGFCESPRPILWIATEEGLNYYNYDENKLCRIESNPKIRFVHGVYEANDSTLWLCTLGQGIIKAIISGTANHPVISDVKCYLAEDKTISSNQFFSMTVDENGKIYFCNRGHGMFELKNEKLVPIPLKSDFGINAVADVFDAIKKDDALWIGTGHGLIKSWPGGENHYFGPENGFANNTIHEMLRDNNGDIWMSTNKGLVRFNPENDESETYGRNYGLTVTEYSDGAGFYTGNTIIFGGINGVTFVNKHLTYIEPEPYVSQLSLLKLSISGRGVPVIDHLQKNNGKNRLTFEANQNHFSLTLAAPDFINAYSYTYYYTLDGHNWINNGPDPTISFNEMRHGKYNLTVKYINRATGVEGSPYSLEIIVKAPWYLSAIAKTIYLLLFIAAICLAIYLYLKRQKKMQEEKMSRLEQAHREEVYEEKLKFFTNITHEFCTPLTLIYGPCERILTYPGSDDYIRKYVGLIRSNAERLNTLIQELIDFRRIETGHKVLKPGRVGVSELCSDIMLSFSELVERNNINFINDIAPGIVWVSDFGCLRKIMTNLISNAFKYTPTGGTIRVSARVVNDKLQLSVYNTGKGLREEDKERIFNRYSVLDNIEENAVKGLSSRNGLGMAICHSMVDMLNGSITIESEVGKFADFIVDLPPLDLDAPVTTDEEQAASNALAGTDLPVVDAISVAPESPKNDKKSAETVLVVDDNKEILTLLCDSLTEYNVKTAESVEVALEIIRQTPPDLIISDIMKPGTDGVAFTRMIKGNKHTMHIPLILLSAKTGNDEKIEGIESGADAYIGKPFSLSYLKAVVKRFIENRSHLREYYNTAASAYEYKEGRLLHREEKEYMEKIVSFIDENINNSELSPEQIATHMKTSLRNLYRKFKELEQPSPNDFIKNHRLSFAAKLLLTTSLTVQEIIYRSGFTNRSHFYKEFDKRYGMTPKDYRMANAGKDSSLDVHS